MVKAEYAARLREKAAALPLSPGVYIMRDAGGKVIYVDKHQLGIEISGRSDKIDYFMMLVKDFGILEMARSGRVAISKKSPEEI